MAEQIVLPFRFRRKSQKARTPRSSDELIGLSYYDGDSIVVVTGCSPSNPDLVVVKRESDGKRWTVPAGLIRLILGNKRTLRRIA